jgi:hypothetical protein
VDEGRCLFDVASLRNEMQLLRIDMIGSIGNITIDANKLREKWLQL